MASNRRANRRCAKVPHTCAQNAHFDFDTFRGGQTAHSEVFYATNVMHHAHKRASQISINACVYGPFCAVCKRAREAHTIKRRSQQTYIHSIFEHNASQQALKRNHTGRTTGRDRCNGQLKINTIRRLQRPPTSARAY